MTRVLHSDTPAWNSARLARSSMRPGDFVLLPGQDGGFCGQVGVELGLGLREGDSGHECFQCWKRFWEPVSNSAN